MNQEQLLKAQGWTDENISKLKAITNNREAYEYAMKTNDIEGAFKMTQTKEINLNDWFQSFVSERPSDAETLSIALTEFSEYVRSKTENPSN